MTDFWAIVGDIYNTFRIPFNVAITILCALAARWVLLAASRRVLRNMLNGVHKKNGTQTGVVGVPATVVASRQLQRTKTMGAVLTNSITWIIVGIATIQVMSELGVSVGAIIASAGIATAALGFGAQNIVKDILNGMFMVFEDQLGVGDKVDLGLAIGVVENVGVRITTLKGDDGTIWFVRNGEITRVGNMSYAASVKAPVLRRTAAQKKADADKQAARAAAVAPTE
jgi:small-conductance mechanosensitive channel